MRPSLALTREEADYYMGSAEVLPSINTVRTEGALLDLPLLVRRTRSPGELLALLCQVEHDRSRIPFCTVRALHLNVPCHLPVKLAEVWAAMAGASAASTSAKGRSPFMVV